MKYLFYDIESCTGSYIDGSLCSLGYCITDTNFEVLDQRDIIINPAPAKFFPGWYGRNNKIPKLAYDESVFRSEKKFPQHYDEITSLFSGDILVFGYAIENDVKYLNGTCDFYSLNRIPFTFLDVALIYDVINKATQRTRLEDLAKKYEIEYRAHRSDEDARATMEILKAICKENGLTLSELISKYEIIPGINKENSTRPTYNKTYLDGRAEKQRNKKYLNILFDKYNESLPTPKDVKQSIITNKKILFASNYIYDNPDKTRSIQNAMIKYNARIEDNLFYANIIVLGNDERRLGYYTKFVKSHKNKKMMSEKEFFDILGEYPLLSFNNDSETIINYLEENDENARMTKDRIEGDSSLNLGDVFNNYKKLK